MHQANMSVFILILLVQMALLLALDESNKQGRPKELHNRPKFHELGDPKLAAIVDPGCICGVTAWNCCRKRRTLSKVRK